MAPVECSWTLTTGCQGTHDQTVAKPMRFGISTHLFHSERLERDHLVEIAAHGFDSLELFATRSHFDYRDLILGLTLTGVV